MEVQQVVALVVYIALFGLIVSGLLPRTLVILVGAGVLVLSSALVGLRFPSHGAWLPQGFQGLDWNVVFLFVGMLVLRVFLKRTGVIPWIGIKFAKITKGSPAGILLSFSLITAVVAGVWGPGTAVLLMVPLVLLITVELGVAPTPFVVAQAMAAGIGGALTPVGDPIAMLVRSGFHLDFWTYVVQVGPALLVVLVVFCGLSAVFFGATLRVPNERKARIMDFDEAKALENKPLLFKTLTVALLMMAGFLTQGITGLDPSVVAFFGGALLLLWAGRQEWETLLAEVDWAAILTLVGFLVLAAGAVSTGLVDILARALYQGTGGNLLIFSLLLLWVTGLASAFLDKVPVVAVMIPLIQNVGVHWGPPGVSLLWTALVLGAAIGGNGTLLGATASRYSVASASESGFPVSFWQFTKYGLGVALISLGAASVLVWGLYALVPGR